MLLVFAVTFAFTFAFAGADSYAASSSKKYYLPKNVRVTYYDDEDRYGSVTNIKYDKYDNMTSALLSEMIPVTYKIKYRDKKGTISSVTYGDGEVSHKKYYNEKGLLKKVVNYDKYVYTKNKKGYATKVTCNGKKFYNVKTIKYQKNGFVSKVVYNNGNINYYNSEGLMTSAIVKTDEGAKYTYKYYKKNGKIVKIIAKRNGKKMKKITLEYGKATTKDIWKYSCIMSYTDCPSNAVELCTNNSLSGMNGLY
jgi:hypothetical protein